MEISKLKLSTLDIVGSGAQENIYRINNEMVGKICHNIPVQKKMRKLKLNNFVVPIHSLKERGITYGYVYPYIDSTDYKSVIDLTQKELLENIKSIILDITELSKEKIIISDLIPKNTLIKDKKIYIVDLDEYKICNLDEEEVFSINLFKLGNYFKALWVLSLVESGLQRNELKGLVLEKDYVSTIALKMEPDDSIREYVKKQKNSYLQKS